MFKRWYAKIILVLAVMGPALIAGTANNDAGGISTYSYVGSRFGYLLLWVLVINFFTLAVTQDMGIRLGTYTGKGLAALIRERFGARLTLFAVAILFFANLAIVTSEFAGLAAAGEIFGISKYFLVPVLAIIIWFVLYRGSFKKVEKFFVSISLLFLVYIVAALMTHPDWGEVAKSAITPYFSFDPIYFYALLGIMGTTITPWGQFFIQSYVVDKGLQPKHERAQKIEVYFAAFFTVLIAAAIIVTTKNVLFDNGIVVDSAEKAALSLVPILGLFAKNIFAIGFLFASLLGAFILPLTTSYSICEALGFEHGMDTDWKDAPAFYGIMAFTIIFGAVFVLLPFTPLFATMLFAQVLNGILLPIILIFLVLLYKKRKELGLPVGSRAGRIFYAIVGWEAILRLTFVSLLLIIFTLFPSFLERVKDFF